MTKHCDDYIHDFEQPMCLRWWLLINRLPAADKILCDRNEVKPKLFAKLNGKRVRVTMASRLGDVGISYDMKREMGYEERVAVADLAEFIGELCSECNGERFIEENMPPCGERCRMPCLRCNRG